MVWLPAITCLAVTGSRKIPSLKTNKEDKSNVKKLAFKNMVDSQHFVFIAQSAKPLRGNFRNLTSQYDVTISNDTMVSYLPYFGRAYTAPITPSEIGTGLHINQFAYEVNFRAKKMRGLYQLSQRIARTFSNISLQL